MSTRITFARDANGEFSLGESKLGPLVARLFAGNPEPRIPAELMANASRELVGAVHRFAAARGCDFSAAARHVIRERPALFKLTRAVAVSTAPDCDVEDEAP